jgi:hypothetical protein
VAAGVRVDSSGHSCLTSKALEEMAKVARIKPVSSECAEERRTRPDMELAAGRQPPLQHRRCAGVQADDATPSSFTTLDGDSSFLEVDVLNVQCDELA